MAVTVDWSQWSDCCSSNCNWTIWKQPECSLLEEEEEEENDQQRGEEEDVDSLQRRSESRTREERKREAAGNSSFVHYKYNRHMKLSPSVPVKHLAAPRRTTKTNILCSWGWKAPLTSWFTSLSEYGFSLGSYKVKKLLIQLGCERLSLLLNQSI